MAPASRFADKIRLLLRDAEGRPKEFDLSETGDWHVVLEFDWPALKPQPYTLTLGIGEGVDAHLHVVQCWAHDCYSDPRSGPGQRDPRHGRQRVGGVASPPTEQ